MRCATRVPQRSPLRRLDSVSVLYNKSDWDYELGYEEVRRHTAGLQGMPVFCCQQWQLCAALAWLAGHVPPADYPQRHPHPSLHPQSVTCSWMLRLPLPHIWRGCRSLEVDAEFLLIGEAPDAESQIAMPVSCRGCCVDRR